MLVSGSRGGKGVSVIVPNLCLWPGSLVVVDPKGENATLTASRRGQGSEHCQGINQAVHVLDPMKVARVDEAYRATFNPLDALDPESPHVIDDATRIADALVEIGQGESRQWDEGARGLVRTLLLHVLTHPHYQGRRNLVTVRRLILQGEKDMADEIRERRAQRGESGSPSAHVILWELARQNGALNGVIAASADSLLESAKNSAKQYNSYRIIAERCTEFLDSPGMASCVSSSSFSLADLKTDPKGVSIYLSLPQRFMNTHYRWLRMMIALTVTEMETVAGQPASGAPVLMVLDEFAGLRRMDIIENGVAQIAGFGVKMLFVLQSLEQLKSVYPDRWETFLANCGVQVFFATTDNFTNQHVSDALGEQEIVRTTRNRSQGSGETDSHSETMSESQSQQFSTADTRSKTTGSSYGGSRGTSTGGNRGFSRGSGISSSDGASFSPEWFFAKRTGRQQGTSKNSNTGSSQGTNWGSNAGRNWSSNKSSTRSSTITEGTGTSTSQSYQAGSSHSRNLSQGESEQILKKPLLTKDEMAKLFNRIDDPAHPAYPGLMLVRIAGEAPLLLRRTPYHQDHAFIGLFEPHPDHPFIPYSRPKNLENENSKDADFSAKTYDPNLPLTEKEAYQLAAIQKRNHSFFTPSFKYKSTLTLPYSIDFVWAVLTHLEYIPLWCYGAENSNFSADKFTTGTDFGPGFVDYVNPGISIGFRIKSVFWCDMEVYLHRNGDNFTNVELRQFFYPDAGIIKWLFHINYMIKYAEKGRDAGEYLLQKQLQNLSNACFDIKLFGKPENAFSSSNRYDKALYSGTFRSLIDMDDLVGEEVYPTTQKGNKFVYGFIEYKDENGKDATCECYLYADCVITEVFKKDGDEVIANERIMMFEYLKSG